MGVGLLRGRRWSRTPAYAILGAYVLLGWSVAGMAWNQLLSGDPDASVGLVIGVTGIAGAAFVYFLYRPLFTAAAAPRQVVDRDLATWRKRGAPQSG